MNKTANNKEVKIVEVTMSVNNETESVKENEMKKQLTVKELANTTNVPEGTIRAWMMKPIDGVPYSASNINYTNIEEKLTKYFSSNEKFVEQFGFNINEIEIVKTQKQSKEYLTTEQIKELEKETKIILHNYSLKTPLTFKKFDEQLQLFIFNNEEDDWKAYSEKTLNKPNIKIELA